MHSLSSNIAYETPQMIHHHFHVRDINLIPSNPLFTFRLLILLDAAAGDPDIILVVREGLGAPDGPVSTYPTRGADPTPARLVRFILNNRQTKNYDNYSQFSRYAGQPREDL